MTLMLVDRSPADYVRHLLSPGLECALGPVPLNRYISGVEPGRPADCWLALQEVLGRRTGGSGHPAEEALRRLADQFDSEVTGGWRKVFTGQATVAQIGAVWALLLEQRDWFATLGSGQPFAAYFSGGHPIEAMVADGLFGMDCLGFVGSYLQWVGLRPHVPTCEVPRYSHFLRLEPVELLTDLRPLTVLYWSGTATQHIAIIDRVHEADRNHALVDLCQSSSGGPQRNERVRLGRDGAHHVFVGAVKHKRFAIRQVGTPACPVPGHVVAARHRRWSLTTATGVADATSTPTP